MAAAIESGRARRAPRYPRVSRVGGFIHAVQASHDVVAIGGINNERLIKIGRGIQPTAGLVGPRPAAIVGALETRARKLVVPACGSGLADMQDAAVAANYLRPKQATGKLFSSVVLAAAANDGGAGGVQVDSRELNRTQIAVEVRPTRTSGIVTPNAAVATQQHPATRVECNGVAIRVRLNAAYGCDITPAHAAVD